MSDLIERDDAIAKLEALIDDAKEAQGEKAAKEAQGEKAAGEAIIAAYEMGLKVALHVIKRFVPPADRPQGIYDLIALVNKEAGREDLSDKIKEYLFCDLRKKLWGLDVRPKLGEPIHIPEGTLMREIGAWFDRNPGRVILVERRETEHGPKHIATIEEIMPIDKMQEILKTIADERAERSE